MNNLRHWDFDKNSPYSLYLAADARLSQTDYVDDQVWQVVTGTHDEPALALHTQYGGRAGLVSIIPMWVHAGHLIYQAQTYHRAPIITAFAPGYIAAEGALFPDVDFTAEHLALSSHAIAGKYTLHNRTAQPYSLRFDLFGHVGAENQEQKLAIVTLAGSGHALSMGILKHIAGIVLLEHGNASQLSSHTASPKIGIDITIAPGETATFRWVHAGEKNIRAALVTAREWLNADWQPFFNATNTAAAAIPTIQTGNLDWDALIAASYNRLVQAFLRPAGTFPGNTFVMNRTPEHGFSWRGDGSDYPRTWAGQNIASTYLILSAMASIDPASAEGVIRNYISRQRADGYIDLQPGAAGQQQELLCTPVLARIAWQVYLYTENRDFLQEIFPALMMFFNHWMNQDADNDNIPEWTSDRQTHYLAFPTFAPGMAAWSQGAAIHTVETPDLVAYLISEAHHLQQIAMRLENDRAAAEFASYVDLLRDALSAFWQGDHYAYRDRDTHITTSGMPLLQDGIGDQQHILDRSLASPNRLVVTIVGGVSQVPRITMTLRGLDADGSPIEERVTADQFYWQGGHGSYTTEHVFSHVDMLYCDGLSRVYRIHAKTLDTTGVDINSIFPLWSVPDQHTDELVSFATDKKHFACRNGITMVSKQQHHFDPHSANGAGGIWFYWQTLMGEALLTAGLSQPVTDNVKAQLKMLQQVVTETGKFAQFYHTDDPIPLGEKDHLNGIVPLNLLMQLFNIRIISHKKVYVGGTFHWGRGVTVRQHGVYIRRTNTRIKVEFASGYTVELAPDAEWQAIVDPNPVDPPVLNPIQLPQAQATIPSSPEIPAATATDATLASPPRIIIEVEQED